MVHDDVVYAAHPTYDNTVDLLHMRNEHASELHMHIRIHVCIYSYCHFIASPMRNTPPRLLQFPNTGYCMVRICVWQYRTLSLHSSITMHLNHTASITAVVYVLRYVM